MYYPFSCHSDRKRPRLESLEESKTVGTLADLVGRGKLSVASATEIARGVTEDHEIPNHAIRTFASLGCGGQHPQNCERDLHRWVKNLYGLQLQPYILHVDLQVDSAKVQRTAIRVLAPHEIFHALATMQSKFAFESLMLGNLEAFERVGFWKHVCTLDPWATHPMFQQQDVDWEHLIGVTIHGDGAVMKRDDECFVWSVSSCFSSEGTIKDPLLCKYPIAIIPERHMLSKKVTSSVFVSNILKCLKQFPKNMSVLGVPNHENISPYLGSEGCQPRGC